MILGPIRDTESEAGGRDLDPWTSARETRSGFVPSSAFTYAHEVAIEES